MLEYCSRIFFCNGVFVTDVVMLYSEYVKIMMISQDTKLQL